MTTDSHTDYTQPDARAQALALIEDLQNDLARNLRAHDGGKTIDLDAVIRSAQAQVDRAARMLQSGSALADLSVRDLLNNYWETVERRRACAPTGMHSLDDAMGGGLESKRLVVVLGAPNSGKTTFVHQVADHIADSGRPVLYVTSEDSPHDLMTKTLARVGNVKYTAVKKGWKEKRAEIEAALVAQSRRQSTDLLRYVDASNGISLESIRQLAQAHFGKHAGGAQGVLVVDYLQRLARALRLTGAMSMDLREAVTLLTEQLRALACELDCCVIAIASQHRGGYGGKDRGSDNTLATAKESGDIEYTADVMLALVDDNERTERRGEIISKPLLLKIDKNRQGDRDKKIALDFQPDRQLFTEAGR